MSGDADKRAALRKAREDAHAKVRQLETDLAAAQSHVAALDAEIATCDRAEPSQIVPASRLTQGPVTARDKVRLFRQLFRGRPDVYPTRFVAKTTGNVGYAPACSNKFVRGVCELPKVKCGDCTRQAFQAVDDRAVLAHLKGQHVMGVYPMLEDETCWFLAVDFDKGNWTDDVRAFVQTSRRLSLRPAIERSRSGNGAHVWFFFSGPVPAATARRMGCHLITETMALRHEMGMDSYDRLFPSQDTMPRGGFGNLIALPLQQGPRKEANTVFLNEALEPLPDDQQWAYLASSTASTPSRSSASRPKRLDRDASLACEARKALTTRTRDPGSASHR